MKLSRTSCRGPAELRTLRHCQRLNDIITGQRQIEVLPLVNRGSVAQGEPPSVRVKLERLGQAICGFAMVRTGG